MNAPELKIVAAIREGSPYPRGATWDGQGVNFALYSANAAKVELCLFDSDGRESARIEVPSAQPSCVAFGGARLGTLYITSARVGLNDRALQGDLRAGGVFIATPAARGVAEPVFSGRT